MISPTKTCYKCGRQMTIDPAAATSIVRVAKIFKAHGWQRKPTGPAESSWICPVCIYDQVQRNGKGI